MIEYIDEPLSDEGVERLIEAAVLQEREACAKVCEKYLKRDYDMAKTLAAAIRARSEK